MRNKNASELRDHFAGCALQGYMIWYWYKYPETTRPDGIAAQVVAEECYRIADAMLREKTGSKKRKP